MIFEKIKSLLVENLDCDASEITKETKFDDLGIDSLDITELIMILEDEFNIEIPMENSIRTISDLVKKVEELNKSI
ncbi:MAG: acyl carrier protein [Clostridiales bacterium]|nr:acyl carrier protein [Clostridiales bacterium]